MYHPHHFETIKNIVERWMNFSVPRRELYRAKELQEVHQVVYPSMRTIFAKIRPQ
jgi:hypothetical protein